MNPMAMRSDSWFCFIDIEQMLLSLECQIVNECVEIRMFGRPLLVW